MKDIKSLHRQAMALVQMANEGLSLGNRELFYEQTKKALEIEKEAAFELITHFDSEPTRSVLFRSAASLAYNIGEFEVSEQLIHLALSGKPHIELKAELESLMDAINNATYKEFSTSDVLEYNYINTIREKAVNLKVEAKNTDKYSKAVVVDFIIDFLKNLQSSYRNYSEINFKKYFQIEDFPDFENVLSLFKKESNFLAVDFKFESFGIGIVADTIVMNHRYDLSDKFFKFKLSLFEDFQKEVIFPDFNSPEFLSKVSDKYTNEERNKIYSSVLASLNNKSPYTVSIADKDFKHIIKRIPKIHKDSEEILKPKVSPATNPDAELLLKRTFELTDTEGRKNQKLQTEFLSYAEFSITLETIENGMQTLFFINPYEVKLVFAEGTFNINDSFFEIFVEHRDFKEIQELYKNSLFDKFFKLLQSEERSTDEEILLDNMKSMFIWSNGEPKP